MAHQRYEMCRHYHFGRDDWGLPYAICSLGHKQDRIFCSKDQGRRPQEDLMCYDYKRKRPGRKRPCRDGPPAKRGAGDTL